MSSVNLLALPKRKTSMRVFLAPEGYVLIREDVNSLEPRVMAYLTQDENLLKLYGKDAKPHDGYLFVAWYLLDKVKEHYDIDDITVEKRNYAKDICEEERTYIKPAFLGWFYGLGAYNLSLKEGMPLKDAKRFMSTLDKLFKGKFALHNALIKKWTETGGHVISARGTPICCCNSKKKDIVNRVVQRSGHELLQRLLYHRNEYRKKHNIEMYPYIPDFHDESVWMVRPHDVDRAKEAINYSYAKLNEELNWNVSIDHGGISVGKDLTIRCD
jgi:DNA polymerase I-like protein with 3'-5' exonuclease and polymerase domains